jgi:hypothetical protein
MTTDVSKPFSFAVRPTFLALCWAASLASAQTGHGPLCDIRPAQSDDAIEYVQTLIRSLAVANASAIQYGKANSTEPKSVAKAIDQTTQQMLDTKHLNQDYRCAADMLKGYRTSSKTFIREGSTGIYKFFDAVIQLNEAVIAGLRFAISNAGKPTFDAGEFADDMTNLGLSLDGTFNTLPTLAEASLYALIDSRGDEEQPPSRLTITANERQDLIAFIDREFPSVKTPVKKGDSVTGHASCPRSGQYFSH